MAGYKKMAHENGSKSETQNGNPNRNLHEKINPEYYQLLSKAARHITVLPSETARTAMEALKAQDIPFSAVHRSDQSIAITVHKDHAQALEAACEPAAVQPVRRTAEKINPDYYKKLDRNDRQTEALPTAVAEQLMQSLEQQKIPFSAVRRSDDVCAVTVSKSLHAETLRQTIQAAEQKHTRQLIHPEVFKRMAKEERFTQRMSQDEAEKAVAKLEKQGISHSAVLDGNKSGVTVHKKDSFFFTKQRRQEIRSNVAKNRVEQPERPAHRTKSKQKEELS